MRTRYNPQANDIIENFDRYIKEREDGGCVEQYVICYDWRKHDTKEEGTYLGTFNIEFGEVKNDDYTYPTGNLIVPIREDLLITIK